MPFQTLPPHKFSQHYPLQPILPAGRSSAHLAPGWGAATTLSCPAQAPAPPVVTSPPLPISGHWVPHMGLLQSALVLDSFHHLYPPLLCAQDTRLAIAPVCGLTSRRPPPSAFWPGFPPGSKALLLYLLPLQCRLHQTDHPTLWTGHASFRWNSSQSLSWLCWFHSTCSSVSVHNVLRAMK